MKSTGTGKIGLPIQITKKITEHFKSPDIGLKNAQTIFQKNSQISFFGEKISL
jgi:hypothetical protein